MYIKCVRRKGNRGIKECGRRAKWDAWVCASSYIAPLCGKCKNMAKRNGEVYLISRIDLINYEQQ